MKKIIVFLLLFWATNSFAQPVQQRGTTAVTVQDARLSAQLNFFVPRYADTTAANVQKGIDTCGAIIYTYNADAFWYRQCFPKQWKLIGAGGSTDSSVFATHYYVDSSINSIGVPDLQSVTDAGNTTTNTITLDGGDLNVDGGNVVLRGDLGSNISWTDNVNSTSLQCLLPLKNATIFLPDTSGTLALSVNGNFADSSGNITIPSATTPTLQEVVNAGDLISGVNPSLPTQDSASLTLKSYNLSMYNSDPSNLFNTTNTLDIAADKLNFTTQPTIPTYINKQTEISSSGLYSVYDVGSGSTNSVVAGESQLYNKDVFSSGEVYMGSVSTNDFKVGIQNNNFPLYQKYTQYYNGGIYNRLYDTNSISLNKGTQLSFIDNSNWNTNQVIIPRDTSGFLTLSVNGNKADSTGNITIPSGGGGGGSSVNYYLNGSVNQGTFGGDTYYQLSKNPIAGAGTNFTRTNASGNGYIASFITDAGDPNLLNMPGGNWNLEVYFNSSSSGGSPTFYGEIYKVSAANVFTLIASGSTNPEGITNGTTVDQYFTSIPVPQTTLVATDRIAIRIFVTPGGRNITLHTEDNNLSEVLTTFSTGLNALNGLTAQVQYFAVDTSGTDFNISSDTNTHTFNLPTASATNRGALSSADWSTFNGKQDSSTSWKTTGNFNVNAGQFIGSRNNASLRFRTNNTESMVLDSVGRLQLKSISNLGTSNNVLQLANTNNRSFFNINTNSAITELSLKANNNGVLDSMVINDSGLIAPRTNATLWLKPTNTTNYNVVANRCAGCGTGSIFSANAGTSAPVFNVSSTGATSIGAASAATSSLVDMTSTSLGLLIPRMTTNQRNSITSPASQLLVSNTEKQTIDQYNGTSWNSIAGDFSGQLQMINLMGGDIIGVPFHPISMTTGSTAFGNTFLNMVAIVVQKETIATGVQWQQGTQGVYTANNTNGVALYSVNPTTYVITKIAESTNDGNIWKGATGSIQTKDFASPVTIQPGLYYIGALYNASAQTTAPVVWGTTLGGLVNSSKGLNVIPYSTKNGQNTFPATYSAGTSANYSYTFLLY